MTSNAFGSVGSRRPRSTRSSLSLDEGGVRLEEISRLQGTVSTYKGHLTRRYNDIRSLFANNATVTEIMMKRNSLDDILRDILQQLRVFYTFWLMWKKRKELHTVTKVN